MRLTNKCSKEFYKWLEANYKDVVVFGYQQENLDYFQVYFDNMFDELPDCAKFGVYQLYFDSVSSPYVDVILKEIVKGFECFYIEYEDEHGEGGLAMFKTRQEAQTEAIKQANEIRNQQLG